MPLPLPALVAVAVATGLEADFAEGLEGATFGAPIVADFVEGAFDLVDIDSCVAFTTLSGIPSSVLVSRYGELVMATTSLGVLRRLDEIRERVSKPDQPALSIDTLGEMQFTQGRRDEP